MVLCRNDDESPRQPLAAPDWFRLSELSQYFLGTGSHGEPVSDSFAEMMTTSCVFLREFAVLFVPMEVSYLQVLSLLEKPHAAHLSVSVSLCSLALVSVSPCPYVSASRCLCKTPR